MRYKLLGKSGLRVSELALGTMTFGETWGWGASHEESQRMFERFAEAGGNFIDTSVNYTDGTSETFLGDFLSADRPHFVVATKYTLTKSSSTDPNSGGNSRKNMVQSVERSLKPLHTDYLDVLYLHMWDYMTPVEEVVRGMDDLVRAGKVIYVAISDSPAYIVAEANTLADLRGWSRFIGLQLPYSLADRAIERELLPLARHWDMAVMPWGLVGGGILTGKYGVTDDADALRAFGREDQPARAGNCRRSEQDRAGDGALDGAGGDQLGAAAAGQSADDPDPGRAHRLAQLADNLAVLEWELDADQLERLEAVSKIDLGFPHGFLDGNRNIFGATFDQIDNHHQ